MATAVAPKLIGLDHFTAAGTELPLLRISTAGSVDDGKSTLIGRLLFDSRSVLEDHLDDVRKSKVNRASRGIDLSLLTDGLRAEREQGITIDVAYRYFATARRKFIVADTPGHEQYTRNMATGASTSDLAIILIDARKGFLPQSRRHAFISWLLGVRTLVFAVNKMDLVEFSRDVFEEIRAQADRLLALLEGAEARFIPISALDGDNVVTLSSRTAWYEGAPLLEILETARPAVDATALPFRFPVQTVIRPDLDFRGFAGQIASGRIRVGDEVIALPSGHRSRIARIVTFDGDLEEAFAPMSVTLVLEDERDIARGDMLVAAPADVRRARTLEASVVWMNERPAVEGASLLLQQGPRTVPARISRVLHAWDADSLETQRASGLELNQIGVVEIAAAEPIFFDPYRENRATGGFILIDRLSNLTVAAGLIERSVDHQASSGPLSAEERARLRGHRGAWIDLSAVPEIAPVVERELLAEHKHAVLDAPVELAAQGLIVLTTGGAAGTPDHRAASGDVHAEMEAIRRVTSLASAFVEGEGI
jgi:sulfate adenylyltransferase large subunit